jgi:F420-non-reducing hydrogenase small subunit
MAKLKFAFYWAATCGGCEEAVLDINEKILDVVELADIVFWPVALDFKYQHLKAMEDKSIDVCFLNGAIRNEENEQIVQILRQKSKVMVAFGACACFGGIPGLGNFTNREAIFKKVYHETPSTNNQEGIVPQENFEAKEGVLTLPRIYDTVKRLKDVVEVEYFLPGCPPVPELILEAVTAIAEDKLPPPGATIAGAKTLCDECDRERDKKIIPEFKRPYEIIPDTNKCLLEQGIICAGPATRAGCGQKCINVNMGCRGCFGPPEGVIDQGAALLSALASICETKDERKNPLILDPAGLVYRFSLPDSLLKRSKL